MESPTTKDALQRVSEAEKRIRMLADQVYSHQQGHSSGADGQLLSASPSKTNSALARDTERTERKYEVLEQRVRELESLVMEMRKEIWQLKAGQSTTGVPPQHSQSTAPQTASPSRSPPNGEITSPGVRFHTRASDLHLEGLSTIPTALSKSSMSHSRGSLGSLKADGKTASDIALRLAAIQQIHSTFDLDGDGLLNYNDAAKMQEITDNTELNPAEYRDLCAYLYVDAAKGLSIADLARMYSDSNLGSDLDRDVERARSFV